MHLHRSVLAIGLTGCLAATSLIISQSSANAITAQCPSGMSLVSTSALKNSSGASAPVVFKLYKSSSKACVIAQHTGSAVGQKFKTSVSVAKVGGKASSDTGNFAHYAGPTTISAGTCVSVNAYADYKGKRYSYKNANLCKAIPAPSSNWTFPGKNPYNEAQMLAFVNRQDASTSTKYSAMCLAFVASAYGWGGSGKYSAQVAWNTMPAKYKHAGDRTPPKGALVFYRSNSGLGHVAIYLGNGTIASTDLPRYGQVGKVALNTPERQWGQTYLGWTEPYFPSGW